MSDRTNDEKLKILQERLAQIQKKQEINANQRKATEKITDTHDDKIIDASYKRKPSNSSLISKTIFIVILAYGLFFVYNKFTYTPIKKEITETSDIILQYNINLKGDNIAIIRSFKDENSAKALVNNLKVKGFKTDFFFLPDISNSTEEVYQVFIGPYENEDETSQWVQNIDREVSIISISKGIFIRNMKSNSLIEKEKQERIAKEKAEKEKQERIAKEKAENERRAKEQAENEKRAKEQAENEKRAKEQAENERRAKEQAENERREELAENERRAKIEAENKRIQIEEETFQKELEKQRKLLLLKNPKILISYTYKFIPTVENEGILIIDNNAGYPRIKQNFSNIISQGGIDNIIKNMEYDMNAHGALVAGIYFEKSGTIVPAYSGKITEVYW